MPLSVCDFHYKSGEDRSLLMGVNVVKLTRLRVERDVLNAQKCLVNSLYCVTER